jgi:hypothetical protein
LEFTPLDVHLRIPFLLPPPVARIFLHRTSMFGIALVVKEL